MRVTNRHIFSYIMDRCDRCERKFINQWIHSIYMLWIDVIDVKMKLQIRLINRHIISFIMDICNRCEYKSINKSKQ